MTRTGLGTLLAVVAFGMTTAMAQRHVQTLNDGWRFLAGDVDNGEKTWFQGDGQGLVQVAHDACRLAKGTSPVVGLWWHHVCR